MAWIIMTAPEWIGDSTSLQKEGGDGVLNPQPGNVKTREAGERWLEFRPLKGLKGSNLCRRPWEEEGCPARPCVVLQCVLLRAFGWGDLGGQRWLLRMEVTYRRICLGNSEERPLINTYLESGMMLMACEPFLCLLSAKEHGRERLLVTILSNQYPRGQWEVTDCVETGAMN